MGINRSQFTHTSKGNNNSSREYYLGWVWLLGDHAYSSIESQCKIPGIIYIYIFPAPLEGKKTHLSGGILHNSYGGFRPEHKFGK